MCPDDRLNCRAGKGEKIKAFELLAKMRRCSSTFLKILPPNPASEADRKVLRELEQAGLVLKVRGWLTLTPKGWDAARTDPFLGILKYAPGIANLEQLRLEGVLDNAGGMPTLTRFGILLQGELKEGEEYVLAHYPFDEGETVPAIKTKERI